MNRPVGSRAVRSWCPTAFVLSGVDLPRAVSPKGLSHPLQRIGGRVTVVVAVAAPDGIVLAAESRTTVTMGERHRIVSDSAQKVFSIREQIGVLTYGSAFLGAQTIAGVLDEFDIEIAIERKRERDGDEEDDGDPVGILWGEEIATQLGDFFDKRAREVTDPQVIEEFEEQGRTLFGFLVAGYDYDGIGHIREVTIPGPTVEDLADQNISTATMGAAWRGQTDVIGRLIRGVDGEELMRLGVDISDEMMEALPKLSYNLMFPITMQDAVDFAAFLIRTTIDMQRFSDGTFATPGGIPGCGGPIRILAVTAGGTDWVTEPIVTAASRPGAAAEGAGGSGL